jgi:hypothetical protein
MKTDLFGLLAFIHWNHDWNEFHFDAPTLKKSIDQLYDLGISFVRMDILWQDVHAGDHLYNFQHYDPIIEALEKKGIHLLALCNYGKTYAENGKEIWNRPPESDEEFAAYVAATVNRYKSWVKHWEIWNEPNHPEYWSGPKDGLMRYSSLLKASYKAAKAADPACTVLNGGLTAGIADDVENLYRAAGKDSFDVLNIHPFINPKKPNAVQIFDSLLADIENTMRRHGDDQKKIWITEMGCPGVPKGSLKRTWFEGDAQTEEEQAEWLEGIYALAKKYPRIEKVFWAFYRDTDGMFKDATDHLGIVRNDLSPKPAYHALKRLIAGHALR